MVDCRGMICEYDDYKIPPAPEVVTPEMIQRRKEIMIEFKEFAERLRSTRHIKEVPTFK